MLQAGDSKQPIMPSGDELVHYFIESASIASPHIIFFTSYTT
jgi:hypothetical protein